MEESIKNKIIVILGILTAIFFISSVSSCSNVSRQRNAFNKEMYARLSVEEKMSKLTQEKTVLEEKLKEKDRELAEEKAASQATRKALVQEQLVSQSMKEELQKVIKLKEALEEDLKEALVAGKTAKNHK